MSIIAIKYNLIIIINSMLKWTYTSTIIIIAAASKINLKENWKNRAEQ